MSAERKGRGFRQAGALVSRDIREAGEARGFAVARVLTHWPEIAGADLAAKTRPVRISYARGGLGATLTLLTTGAEAPLVEMQAERLRERVNACYGYNAIARIRITQTAPSGFAEAQAAFVQASRTAADQAPTPEVGERASRAAAGIADERLRDALERLGAHVLSRAD